MLKQCYKDMCYSKVPRYARDSARDWLLEIPSREHYLLPCSEVCEAVNIDYERFKKVVLEETRPQTPFSSLLRK